MHEMSIAAALMTQLEQLASDRGIERFDTVTVAAGELRQIVPEALHMAFESVAEGSVAQGAELELQIVPPEARCRQCGASFRPLPDSFLCEKCGRADVDIVKGNDIVLLSVTCRQEEPPADED